MTPVQAAKLCDRNFGIGGDGVIFALPPVSSDVDYTMRIYNSDGSEPEMCGNGIRCLARFVADVDAEAGEEASSEASSSERTYRVSTGAGLIQPTLLSSGLVRVDMGEPILEPARVPTTLRAEGEDVAGASPAVERPLALGDATFLFTTVSMGNPHAITYAVQNADGSKAPIDLDAFPLATYGPLGEADPHFPAKTNVEFVQVYSRSHVRMVVWERGAGPTLACGTGACATVVAGVLAGLVDRTAQVDLPGGPLLIEWDQETNHVFMTGPGEKAFEGSVDV